MEKPQTRRARTATEDPPWVRGAVIAIVVTFVTLMLLLPMVTVFFEAFRRGLGPALEALTEPDALSSIKLTLLTAAITVPFNAMSLRSQASTSSTNGPIAVGWVPIRGVPAGGAVGASSARYFFTVRHSTPHSRAISA